MRGPDYHRPINRQQAIRVIQSVLTHVAELRGHEPGAVVFGRTDDGRYHLFAPICCGESLGQLAAQLLILGNLKRSTDGSVDIAMHLEALENIQERAGDVAS